MADDLAPSGDLSAVDQEIAAIENEIRVNRSEYFRNQGMQDRYENLLAIREASGPGSTPASAGNDNLEPASLDDARSFLAETPAGQRLLREWGGSFGTHLHAAQSEALSVLNGMSAAERSEIMGMVDALSPDAYAALLNKLAKRARR